MHLDVIVDDLDAAEAAVIDVGATKIRTSAARPSGSSWTRQVTPSAFA
ncbi:VOC family protein [Amycolatopsis sp. cmx-4-68]